MLTEDKIEKAIKRVGGEDELKTMIKTRLRELYEGAPFKSQTESVNLIEIVLDEIISSRLSG
ncbi:MAG: hypothetical protein HY606_08385 [Planctomycetes bacterium]|nr:hypothetical protein [Planctomycetota bacterium]